MARPRVDDNPVYVEVKARFEPLKNKVANARIMADAMVENAKREVEQEMLALVRYGIENGLSRNAIGRITGKTSNADQVKLVERAMASGFTVPLGFMQQATDEPETTEPEAPVAYPDGWEFGGVDGDPNDGAVVVFSNPAGELFRCRVEDGLRRYYDEADGHLLAGDESFDRVPYEVDVWLYWLLYGEAPIGYMP